MVFSRVARSQLSTDRTCEGSEGDLRASFLKKNALFLKIIVCVFANIRKKPYLCPIKIKQTNNRAAQLVKLCTEDMTQQEIQATLAANRDIVINYFNENCKDDKFYNLKWFMTSILKHAQITWVRRKNISEKDVMSVINQIVKCNPFLLKGYKSNWEKAVYYHGYDLAKNISNCK